MATAAKTFHVRIHAQDREALAKLPIARMDRGCTGGVREQADGTLILEALVADAVLKEIKGPRIKVEVLADLTAEEKKKQRQVGRGNRFEGEDWIPRGLGKKVRAGEKP